MNEWIFSVDLESLPVSLLTTARHLLSPQEVYDNCAGDTQKLGLTEDSAFSRRRGLALNSDTAHPLGHRMPQNELYSATEEGSEQTMSLMN